jgi:hypothetical protein
LADIWVASRNKTANFDAVLQLCGTFAILPVTHRTLGSGIMGKATEQTGAQAAAKVRGRDWRKAMSDHVAYGLLVYTALQIFVTVHALSQGTSGLLPFMALIVLVAGIIPVCRWFEKRWSVLNDAQAADPGFAPLFRRDVMALWALAIGLPFALTLMFKAALAAF